MLVSRDFRSMGKGERSTAVREEFGIDYSRLSELRQGSVYSRLERAALAVYEGKDGRGERGRLGLITGEMLGYLTGVQLPHISRALRERYGEGAGELKAAVELEPPYTELFRHDITKESLPFLKERKCWKGFVPGVNDWRRDVTLPLPPFNRSESQMVGVIYGDGFLHRVGKISDGHTLNLCGVEKDEKFYRDSVAPCLGRMFNLPLETRVVEIDNRPKGGKENYLQPIITVGSKAVATWLTRDLGFPRAGNRKRELELPVRYADREGLFEGIVASMGLLQRGALLIHDKDMQFVKSIKSLANFLGRHPSFRTIHFKDDTTKYQLYFGRDAIAGISFINPEHSN